jgi:hypothetical protein
MGTKYNWSAWDSDVPGAIKDNFDDYRTDDTCKDVNDTTNAPTSGAVDKLAADLAERNKYRFKYYLPGSPEDLSSPRAAPRIETANIVHTVQLEVYIRGRSAHG